MDFFSFQKKQKFNGSYSSSNPEVSFFAGSSFSCSPEASELPPPIFKHRNAFLNQTHADPNPALDASKIKLEDRHHIDPISEDRSHTENSTDLIFNITHL
jgi:hypothetical protein